MHREDGPECDVCTPLLGDALFSLTAVAYLEGIQSREFAGDAASSQLADLHLKMVDWQVRRVCRAAAAPRCKIESPSSTSL